MSQHVGAGRCTRGDVSSNEISTWCHSAPVRKVVAKNHLAAASFGLGMIRAMRVPVKHPERPCT